LRKLFYSHSLTRAALSSQDKELNAYMLADSIKEFWRRISSLDKTVAINIVTFIRSWLIDCESGVIHLRRCLLIVGLTKREKFSD
jgi:hypothetical protein